MVRKPKVKIKKHQILGGIKVSSNQLSEWGKTGGRPQKWTNEAERKRATRLRKKQAKEGKKAQLRPYRNYESSTEIKTSLEMICSNCQAGSIGGPQHLGGSCWRFCGGKMIVKDKNEKRAGSGKERIERFRTKRETNINKEQECQHDWEIISDFASYGYSQCRKCGKMM